MSLLVRTGIFVAMAITTVCLCYALSNPKTNPEAGVVVWLPREIPDSNGEIGHMGEQERKWLPADTTYLKMTYKERGLEEALAAYRALNVTLIVAGSDSRSLHRPQVCLTAQGWAISQKELVKLQTTGGFLKVMNFHLTRFLRNDDGSIRRDEKGNKMKQRAFYCYWWVGPDDSTPFDTTRVWKSVWNSILKGENERWAYPAVMIMVDERFPDRGVEEAKKRAYSFIEDYAPMFQKSLGAIDREGALELRDL